MNKSDAHIIDRLQKDILPLLGIKRNLNPLALEVLPGIVNNSFPNGQFPLGAIHEFIYRDIENAAATAGFVSGILSSLLFRGGVCIWISSSRTIFPPALKSFGVTPDKIIFIDLKNEKEMLWVMEEALKCNGLAAVVGEMTDFSFTASRRLQLAVEQSQVTGFILRDNPNSLNTSACVCRWMITALKSEFPDDMPGVGFPRWNVELIKVRNGKPGTWPIEYSGGGFRHIPKVTAIEVQLQKKTG